MNRKILLPVLLLLTGSCTGTLVGDAWTARMERKAKTRRAFYLAEHPELPEEFRDAIDKGEVLRGMSRDDVRASWGIPERQGWVELEDGRVEMWEYGAVGLSFSGGVVNRFFDVGPS